MVLFILVLAVVFAVAVAAPLVAIGLLVYGLARLVVWAVTREPAPPAVVVPPEPDPLTRYGPASDPMPWTVLHTLATLTEEPGTFATARQVADAIGLADGRSVAPLLRRFAADCLALRRDSHPVAYRATGDGRRVAGVAATR